MGFSNFRRKEYIETIKNKKFDLLIIGGGITGAGIALDAASRGMKTVLLEMQDFAAGTSSRSTKLVHGGLRYLKQFEVRLVAEVGKERAIVYENGPHVTTPERMLLPIYKEGTFGKFSTSIGLKIYDYLAGVKHTERRKMLNRQKTLDREPLLKQNGLVGSGYYVEYRTDDARLTIEVLKEAVKQGAMSLNYSKVEEFIYRNGRVIGARFIDQMNGQKYEVFAKKIVNATGPWVDTLREMDDSKKGKRLQLTKGIHLVIDQKYFPLKQAIYFDTPDGRMVFSIPRDGKTYIGTTDTKYEGDIVHPRMTRSDREYLIKAVNFMFPDLNITEKHIESSWTGLRPLIYEEGKNASEISRKDEIWQSTSGLITIAGGKLTGYRKMAEIVVDLVGGLLEKEGSGPFSSCHTKTIPISGGDVGGGRNFAIFVKSKTEEGINFGFTRDQAKSLIQRYGSNIDRLYGLALNCSKETSLPLDILVCLQYSLEEEMIANPVDFFIRRTGALFFNIAWVQRYKIPVIEYMAKQFKWSEEKKREYTEELNSHLYYAVTPVDTVNENKKRVI